LKETIGVMGCGWLGFPLAKALLQLQYQVYGTTTSETKITALTNTGIHAFAIRLREAGIHGPVDEFLTPIGTIVINVPPKLRGTQQENYVQKMQWLHRAIKKSSTRKLIFVSSTSVYGDVDGEVTEQTIPNPTTASGEQLLAAENMFRNDSDLQTTIVRFGGLIGPHRNPVNMLVRRKNLMNGGAPINLIHLDDCIAILKTIIVEGYWGELFNAVYPHHPPKATYYTEEAKRLGLLLPDYRPHTQQSGKIIVSQQLTAVKNFQFLRPISENL